VKIISWNVNGLRASIKHGFLDFLEKQNNDIICLQETKLQLEQVPKEFFDKIEKLGYKAYWSFAEKKGYSGVLTISKIDFDKTDHGINKKKFDSEGRILIHEFKNYILFNIYFPNGQMNEDRLKYKLNFYKALFDYANKLKDNNKKIIITGDYNTAHNEIDLKNPKANSERSGFLPIERKWLDKIISMGYIDTFRTLFPDKIKYSWWSYRFNARKNNAGWRIDYFFISENLKSKLIDAFIQNDIIGSDHCPVGINLDVEKGVLN